MLKSLMLSTSALTFAKANDEGAAQGAGKIEKVVYMSADDSLKAVVLHVGNAADATLRLISAMVVHLAVRTYHHIEAERRAFNDTKEEITAAFRDYANAKRNKEFGKAWSYRLLSVSVAMARSLVKDYDKKGVQEGSPLYMILRAKTPDKGNDIVFDFINAKTKGVNALSALEKALSPAKKTPPAETGRTGNAVKASTDKPERIGAALVSDKGHEAINAIKGNAKAKALKMAETMSKTNVDHLTFVLRSLLNLTAEECIMVAQAATDRAKELNAAKTQKPVRAKRVKPEQDSGTGGQPEQAAAAIVAG